MLDQELLGESCNSRAKEMAALIIGYIITFGYKFWR